ncbi:hypothetical protein BDR06DRAFT_1054844 [Suillus hirtellus]|nr:hypothetical protein BDR06DRAFT_1054844 [Suillus hirtellus]
MQSNDGFHSLDDTPDINLNQGSYQLPASYHDPFYFINQPQASSSSLRDPAIFGSVSGDHDTIDFDGLTFSVFLDESAANTSRMLASHASTTVPRLIPRSAEIDVLYPLPHPQILQGTVKRTQYSHHTSAPYSLPIVTPIIPVAPIIHQQNSHVLDNPGQC